METGPLNFVTLSRRDFNNQRVKPDENLYFVHEQYVDDKGEVKTKIVLYKGKIPIGLVDKGRDGLSVFRTALSLGDERVVVEQSDIMTDGRALQVGDMFIDDSADNWLYQVTATPGTQAHAERIAPVRGDKGDKGEPGATPNITMAATVGNTTGTPSVSVTKGGTAENPRFDFAFQNIKGEKGDKGDTGVTPDITLYATANNSVGTPSVAVVKNGEPKNPVFTLGFKNIKGEKGDTGLRGTPGLSTYRGDMDLSEYLSSPVTDYKISYIDIPSGRSIQVGDLIIENSGKSYVFKVTAINNETNTVTLYYTGLSLQGDKGDKGDKGGDRYIEFYTIYNNQTTLVRPGKCYRSDSLHNNINVILSIGIDEINLLYAGFQTSYIFLKIGDVLKIDNSVLTGLYSVYVSNSVKEKLDTALDEFGLLTISWLAGGQYIFVDYEGFTKYSK